MTKISEAREELMGWIQSNYYLEMQGLLTSKGYECRTMEDPPWYATNCPRAEGMTLHNEALTNVLGKLDQDKVMGRFTKGVLKMALKQKYFSDADIQKQVSKEQTITKG